MRVGWWMGVCVGGREERGGVVLFQNRKDSRSCRKDDAKKAFFSFQVESSPFLSTSSPPPQVREMCYYVMMICLINIYMPRGSFKTKCIFLLSFLKHNIFSFSFKKLNLIKYIWLKLFRAIGFMKKKIKFHETKPKKMLLFYLFINMDI